MVVIYREKAEIGFVDRFVIAAESVVVTYKNHLVMRYAALLAVFCECILLIIRSGSHIK